MVLESLVVARAESQNRLGPGRAVHWEFGDSCS